MFRKALLILVLALPILAFIMTNSRASALSGSEFQAGRIMDDGVFFNPNTMDQWAIQNFLNAKVPSCETWHSPGYGQNPPFTCLKDYVQNTAPETAESGLCSAYAGGWKTSAQIIYEVSQICGINPKVLLVLLQKEQSLVTDTWPLDLQYRSATGYGCPDTAPCDAEYYGFFNQVYMAARQFKKYVRDSSTYRYRAYRDNYIQYNPNVNCGGTNVYIQNQATAGLYNYTPYQPNASALVNLYGIGDTCGAYGNRNFWRIYNDWFGSTLANAYNYSFVSATNSNVEVQPDETVTTFINILNTGSSTWYSDTALGNAPGATRLALKNYGNTPFADSSDPNWLGTQNQIRMSQASVAPGQIATFIFNMKGPQPPLLNPTLLNFIPVINGVGFMPNIDMQMRVNHIPSKYTFVSTDGIPNSLIANQKFQTQISIRNSGNSTWYADGSTPVGQRPTRLALKNYGQTSFTDWSDPDWLGTRNQIRMSQASVAPGQIATFSFSLIGPYSGRLEKLHFVPVIDGVGFMNDANIFTYIAGINPSPSYSFVSASNPPLWMNRGQIANVNIVLKNTGNTVWKNQSGKVGPFTTRLVMSSPIYRQSSFSNLADPVWLTNSQISMQEQSVNPGGNGTFTFTWKAPSTPGAYIERFTPLIDGYGPMPDIGMSFAVNVP